MSVIRVVSPVWSNHCLYTVPLLCIVSVYVLWGLKDGPTYLEAITFRSRLFKDDQQREEAAERDWEPLHPKIIHISPRGFYVTQLRAL